MPGRIAILGTRGYPSYYGGFETLLRALVPSLAERGWLVDVYSRRSAIVEGFDLPDGVRAVMVPGIDRRSTSTLTFGLSSALHAIFRGYDALLVMNVANGYWLPLLKAAGIKTVVNVDGIEWQRAKWGKLAKRVFKTGATLTAKYADEIVCDSEEIASFWATEFGRDSTFIPYGGHAPNTSKSALEKFESINVEPRRYVLFVARFVPENSISEFLEASRILAATHDVVIVGSSGYGGDIEESVRILAQTNRRVHWLGHVRDDELLFALWENAGTYFHGHSVGGTNPALVQAMACGAPTVARDTPFNREVLGHAGVFVEANPAKIADAVEGVMSDLASQQRLADESRKRQEAFYSWDGVCRKYEATLVGVMRAKMIAGTE